MIRFGSKGSLVLALALSLTPKARASEALTLFEGESATAAVVLHSSLSGSGVSEKGSIKRLVLDGARAIILTCDAHEKRCSVLNSEFKQSFSQDYDELLRLEGPAARVLIEALPSLRHDGNRIQSLLGFSGQYGSDEIKCEDSETHATCTIFRSYCYMPGC